MSKIFSFLSLIIAFSLLSISESQAQLPKGSVGIGSNFNDGEPGLSISYAFAESFDLNLIFGYVMTASTTDFDGEELSSSDDSKLRIGLTGRIFIDDNDAVDPFLLLGFTYADTPLGEVARPQGKDLSSIALNLMFGGQSELATNFFVYAATGISFYTATASESTGVSDEDIMHAETLFELGTMSLGAIFYF